MELEPGVTLTVENITIGDQARQEIDAAREQGIDPSNLIRTHRRLADAMEYLISKEIS